MARPSAATKAAKASANCGARQLSSMSDDAPKPGVSQAMTVWSRARSGSIPLPRAAVSRRTVQHHQDRPDTCTPVGGTHSVDVNVSHAQVVRKRVFRISAILAIQAGTWRGRAGSTRNPDPPTRPARQLSNRASSAPAVSMQHCDLPLRRQDSNLDHQNQNPVRHVYVRRSPSPTCDDTRGLVDGGGVAVGNVAVICCCHVACKRDRGSVLGRLGSWSQPGSGCRSTSRCSPTFAAPCAPSVPRKMITMMHGVARRESRCCFKGTARADVSRERE